MAKTPVIAIVDDDEGVRTSLASLVRSLGYEARTYGSGGDFLREPPRRRSGMHDRRHSDAGHDRRRIAGAAACRRPALSDYFHDGLPNGTHPPARDGRRRALLSRQTDWRRRDHPLPRRGVGRRHAALAPISTDRCRQCVPEPDVRSRKLVGGPEIPPAATTSYCRRLYTTGRLQRSLAAA